ncbi:ferredoxin--NADP(+) reductase [Salinispira pacifica]|uniref:Ferredoxin--NADP(+) reductase n=1 Tax=Salinispira pacifica TaxID=1307761 RepID=V5WJE1_9SPIO|nr:ferredoxin--NADP(+) reductase [Salinispira pacifica]AHC15755.1 Ferredoxin--NADP(+) reductase [Salinispira pacifica]
MKQTESPLSRVKILSQRTYGKSAYILTLDYSPDFIPGQMVALSDSADTPPRLYSIASPPGNSGLEILYTVTPEGELTPRLSQMGPGDTLFVSRPRGEFLPGTSPDGGKSVANHGGIRRVWIANGTGVAPFLSAWRAGYHSGAMLIHGARWIEDFYGSEYVTSTAGGLDEPDKFPYIACLSKPDNRNSAEPGLMPFIFPGRLTSWIEETGAVHLPKDAGYYLCGSEQMIIQVRQLLYRLGIPYSSVISEIYF